MKPYTLFLLIVLIPLSVTAQYTGGAGMGFKGGLAPALSLALINSPTSGGSNDGAANAIALLLSLSSASQYSGGPNDGINSLIVPLAAMAAGSQYTGGSNDGFNALAVSSLNLTAPGMYAGGGDDGFNLAAAPTLPLGLGSSYSGGPNDGTGSVLLAAASLTAGSMYAGGTDDGENGIVALGRPMAPLNNMYAGGSNDGFGALQASSTVIAPLPLIWEDFTVTAKEKDALLYWQVGNERGDAGFNIERSYDGGNFKKLVFIKALGGISSMHQYQYTDPNPSQFCPSSDCHRVYYRLRQIDLDGHYSFSPIRQLPLAGPELQASVYPNPASGTITIRINTTGTQPAYSIALYNNLGALVYKRTMLSQQVHEIDVRNYPSGMYFLNLLVNDHSYPYQITIAH